jgi:hypothetical protein
MPNYCNFSCRITGPKKGIDRFIQAAQTNYTVGESNEPEHFWRVFEFYLGDYKEITNNVYQLDASGYCAWSVHTCFMQDGYQRSWSNPTYNPRNLTHNGITVEQISKEENLVVEFYSDETDFSEHIIIVNGGVYTDDTVDYTECDYEMDWEECNERSGNNWTEEQWKEYFKKEDYYICCEHNWEYADHTKLLKENEND